VQAKQPICWQSIVRVFLDINRGVEAVFNCEPEGSFMYVAGNLIRMLSKGLEFIGGLCQRIAALLSNLLPSVLSPVDLTALIKKHYDESYAHTAQHFTTDVYEWTLEGWEQDAMHRHGITSGCLLVLGAGVGREAVALAQRGLNVVGLDVNRIALQVARKTARTLQVPAQFVQADFLHLPFAPAHFHYAIMSGIMYSAIPGRARRQAWLAHLAQHLVPEGMAILQFLVDRSPPSRSQRVSDAINRVLTTLPGGNRTYQPGDRCAQGHFLHAFQQESEIQDELKGGGVHIRELNWRQGFAIVSFPSESVQSTDGPLLLAP
jgi:2-polyprenyl-3-methyl-5-hydroxy-6-metoxy-1,4-benzoquinol methylase